jgi:hypothetical protein
MRLRKLARECKLMPLVFLGSLMASTPDIKPPEIKPDMAESGAEDAKYSGSGAKDD